MQNAGIDKEKYNAGHNLLVQNGKINEYVVKVGDAQNEILMEYHKMDKKSLKEVDFERFMQLYQTYFEITLVVQDLCLLSDTTKFEMKHFRGDSLKSENLSDGEGGAVLESFLQTLMELYIRNSDKTYNPVVLKNMIQVKFKDQLKQYYGLTDENVEDLKNMEATW